MRRSPVCRGNWRRANRAGRMTCNRGGRSRRLCRVGWPFSRQLQRHLGRIRRRCADASGAGFPSRSRCCFRPAAGGRRSARRPSRQCRCRNVERIGAGIAGGEGIFRGGGGLVTGCGLAHAAGSAGSWRRCLVIGLGICRRDTKKHDRHQQDVPHRALRTIIRSRAWTCSGDNARSRSKWR